MSKGKKIRGQRKVSGSERIVREVSYSKTDDDTCAGVKALHSQ